jgi:hypothetical protein
MTLERVLTNVNPLTDTAASKLNSLRRRPSSVSVVAADPALSLRAINLNRQL